MATKSLNGQSIRVEDIWVSVKCPECHNSFRCHMRDRLTRKNCPLCMNCTFGFKVTNIPDAIFIDVVTIGKDLTPEPYHLHSQDIEFDTGE